MKEYIFWMIEKLLALGFSRKAIVLVAAVVYINTLAIADIYKAVAAVLSATVYCVTQMLEDRVSIKANPTITLEWPDKATPVK